MLKSFLTITALFEGLTGILLLVSPSLTSALLLGAASLDNVTLTIVRITGAAIATLALICWFTRQKGHAMDVVKAMLFYNLLATSVLLYSKLHLGINGSGLIPTMLIHLLLAVWAIVVVVKKPTPSIK